MRINPGTPVVHFKRGLATKEELKKCPNLYRYYYIGVATHTETKELFAVYNALYEDKEKGVELGQTFIRPYDMFMSEVDRKKYPDAKQIYRFEKESSR